LVGAQIALLDVGGISEARISLTADARASCKSDSFDMSNLYGPAASSDGACGHFENIGYW
jgi:hypothetical protein